MTALAKPQIAAALESASVVSKHYMEMLNLIERLHRQLLDVIKDELDRRDEREINSVQALLLFNVGDQELTAGELRTRGHYLGSNVSYNLKKLVEAGYVHHARSELDRRSVLETQPSEIANALAPGDVLFIDGSHYAFNGTDAPFLLLEVLPLLKPGVVVHVHDIMLPYEYDTLFSERNYNEQYLLAGLLLGGNDWEPLLPVYWLSRAGRMAHGASFWLRRRATEAD